MKLPSLSWTIIDPAGQAHSKRSTTRVYTHAVIRENKDNPGSYFVNWSQSKEGAEAESRVLAHLRSYIEVREVQPEQEQQVNENTKPATAKLAEARLQEQEPFNYWEAELSGIKTAGEEDAVKLKLQTSCSSTKWLSLRPSEFEAVEALLVELYAAREQAHRAASQPSNSLEGMHQEISRRKEQGATVKLSTISEEGGLFRWSPAGPLWKRFGVIVREAGNPAHTIGIPNWEAAVWPGGEQA